jgi:hypothetical protein
MKTAQAQPAAPVSEREIEAGMVSYAIECAAAIGLALVIVLAKVLPP